MRVLDTPLAKAIAELHLLETDLIRCTAGFTLFGSIETESGDPARLHLASSLFRDSIVSFVACFDASVPQNLDAESIYKPHADKDAMATFIWLRDLRDTWIAHRHGPSRYAFHGFLINAETGEIEGDGSFTAHYHAPDRAIAPELISLVEIALQAVRKSLAEEIPKLHAQAIALYPNQRLKLPLGSVSPPGPTELRMGRRKFHHISVRKARANEPPKTDR